MNERVHFPQLYNLTTAIRGQELKAYSFPLMRVADKFHKLNRQTPARRPAYMLREHITGKLLETLRKKCAKKSTQNRKSHYNFNAIRQSSISRKAANGGNPDDEMDFYSKTGHSECQKYGKGMKEEGNYGRKKNRNQEDP